MAFRWVKFFSSKKLKIKFRLSFHLNPLLSLVGTAAFYISVMTLSAWFWAAISRADSTNLNSSGRHLLLINDGGGELATNFTDFAENLRLARQYFGGPSEEILNGGGLAAGAFDYRRGKIAASVVTSRDQAATKAQIINSLNRLAKQGGRALVFVTGHGQAEGLVTWDGQLITRKEFSEGLQKSGIPQTKTIFLQCYGAGMLGSKTDEFAKLDLHATQKNFSMSILLVIVG